ncbi:hypothetical protein BMW23_0272 [Bodo saltans virus]|uniref:Uncharacterized protein n=1 Tax=Bodo saltans virus TaxID=2024608 RepID=A0A2H4UTR2_9VIRU|nr:hypothetical protein QJ851_gp0267 [Bodo saltans virus]ATZ80330.1 hypothetical protein BMW23_0272 [Bodo saltans virus]
MSNIFCDIGDVPKGKKRGSMKECAEKGQIKYYGEKKVDKNVLNIIIDKRELKKGGNHEKQLSALKVTMAGLIGKISKMKKDAKDEDDAKKYAKIEKEIKKSEKEFDGLKDKAITLKKKIEQSKLKRTTSSKRSSKRTSKKNKSLKQNGGNKKNKNKDENGGTEMWICD